MEREVALSKFIALVDEMREIIPLERQALREYLTTMKAEAPAVMRKGGAYEFSQYMMLVGGYVAGWAKGQVDRWIEFLFPLLEQIVDLACEMMEVPPIRVTPQTRRGRAHVSR